MSVRLAIVLIALAGCARASAAQDRAATIGGSVSVTSMQSQTDLSFTGAFGFRFTRVVGLELEVSVTPDAGAPGPDAVIQTLEATAFAPAIFPGLSFRSEGGRVVIFSNNVRIEIPTTSERIAPYFVAGGGVANVRQVAEFTFPIPLILLPPNVLPPPPFRQRVVSSSTDLALTLGGGLGVRLADDVFVDVDLRVIRLLGQDDRNAGRFGVGIRYRF